MVVNQNIFITIDDYLLLNTIDDFNLPQATFKKIKFAVLAMVWSGAPVGADSGPGKGKIFLLFIKHFADL